MSGTPTLAQLRAFVAVGRALHFGSAATSLGVSQPTLSAALAGLEQALDVQLVERTTRRVLLTPEGEGLLPRAQAVVEAADGFTDAASGRRALVGTLRMGVIPTVAPYLLPTVLRAVRRGLPNLSLHVREDTTARLLDDLGSARIDVAVVALPSRAHGVTEIPWFDEDFVMVVPDKHRYAGRADLPTTALRVEELLLLDEGHCLRDQALELCRQVRAVDAVSSSARASSLATVVQLVAAGMGTTLVPETALAVESRRGVMGIARFADPVPGRRIGLVHRASSARAAAYEELSDVVCGAMRRLPVTLVG